MAGTEGQALLSSTSTDEVALHLCAPTKLLTPTDLSQTEAPSAWSRPTHGGLPHWRLKRVRDYVDNNLGGEITLADLASVACLSAHHFSELFRQSMGVSPYRYVLDRRIACAKVLLRTSMLGVLDVALAVGFSDQSHFSKMFRRATGVTPGAYRAEAA